MYVVHFSGWGHLFIQSYAVNSGSLAGFLLRWRCHAAAAGLKEHLITISFFRRKQQVALFVTCHLMLQGTITPRFTNLFFSTTTEWAMEKSSCLYQVLWWIRVGLDWCMDFVYLLSCYQITTLIHCSSLTYNTA